MGDAWEDSQGSGPRPEEIWRVQPPEPHGYFEPSRTQLLSKNAMDLRRHWYRLLADNVAPHEVWWRRLMKALNG